MGNRSDDLRIKDPLPLHKTITLVDLLRQHELLLQLRYFLLLYDLLPLLLHQEKGKHSALRTIE